MRKRKVARMKTSTENTKEPMQQAEDQIRILLGLKKMLVQYYKQHTIISSELLNTIRKNYKSALDELATIPLTDDEKFSITSIINYHQKIEQLIPKEDPVLNLLGKIKGAINPLQVFNIKSKDAIRLNNLNKEISGSQVSEETFNHWINHYINKLSWDTGSQIRASLRGTTSPDVLDVPAGDITDRFTNMAIGRNPSEKEKAITIKFDKAREASPLIKLLNTPIPPQKPSALQENNEERLSTRKAPQ